MRGKCIQNYCIAGLICAKRKAQSLSYLVQSTALVKSVGHVIR